MKPRSRRMFPLAGADPARVELWKSRHGYEVRVNNRRVWQGWLYATAYDRYTEEMSR